MKSIIDLLQNNGIESIDFIGRKSRPTVQKDGSRYEILTMDVIDEDTLEMSVVKVYPSYEHLLQYLTVDSTWRKTSLKHIKEIIVQEIKESYM